MWIYRERFQRLCLHCQLINNCCWFGILIGADLLPSTGFNINLVKWSDGGISKFLMQSSFFIIRKFSQFVNSCLLEACFNRTDLRYIARFSFHTKCCYCWIFYFFIFNISKVFFYHCYCVFIVCVNQVIALKSTKISLLSSLQTIYYKNSPNTLLQGLQIYNWRSRRLIKW